MVIDRLHLCKCKKLRYSSEKKRPLPFDRVHKDSKWQKCSPEVITTIIGSFICAGLSWKRFLCSQAGEKGGLGGDLWVNLCTRLLPNIGIPTQWWWRQKCSTPGNIDIPTWAFYCLRPTVVSARCSPITLNCLPFRPPEGLFLTGKLLFIVSKAEKLRNSQSTHIYIFGLLFIFCEI